MDAGSLHMILNHVPAAGAVVSLALLTLALILRRRRLGVIALSALVATGVLAIPASLAGTIAAKHVVEERESALLDRHKEAAIAALISLEAAAATAIAALVASRSSRRFPVFQAAATLVIGLAALTLLVRAAMLGAEVRVVGTRATAARAVEP